MKRVIVGASLLLALSLLASPVLARPRVPRSSLRVTSSDLASAGFPKTKIIRPFKNLYQPPNLYFEIDGGGYLTVLILPIKDPTWSYHAGQPQVLALGHQVQVRESRPGYYLVVTGPDVNRVSALADLLKRK